MRRCFFAVIGLLFIVVTSSIVCPAQQQRDTNASDGLHFEVMPYLLIPWMSGDVTVKGTNVPIDASAGDIFSNLQMGFMARTRLSYNRWFVGTDTVYMGLGRANDVIDAGFDQWAAEALGGYKVHKNVDLLGGVRYNSLSANLQFKGPLGQNPRGAQVWWDPFFGAEGRLPLTNKLSFSARLDIGGFGVGSKIAVNAEPLLHYRLGKHVTGAAGWKFLYQDFENPGKGFEYDVLTQAPLLGVTLRW
jgi:hypothetical protein